MTVTQTPRFDLTQWSAGTDPFSRAQMLDDFAKLEARAVGFYAGTYAARPAATAANANFIYTVTSGNGVGAKWWSDGSAWQPLLTIIPTGTRAARPAAHAGGAGRLYKESDQDGFWYLDNGGAWGTLLTSIDGGELAAGEVLIFRSNTGDMQLRAENGVGYQGVSLQDTGQLTGVQVYGPLDTNDPDTIFFYADGNAVLKANPEGLGVQPGLVGTPGINFISDEDTGLYNVGANSFGLVAGGARKLLVDSNGLSGATLRAMFDRHESGTSAGATPTFDFSAYSSIERYLNVAITSMTFTWPTMGADQAYTVRLAIQTGSSLFAVTWASQIIWVDGTAPTLSINSFHEFIFTRLWAIGNWRTWGTFVGKRNLV